VSVGGLFALQLLHHRVGRGVVAIVVLSMLSAAAYGLAAVLQHHAASEEPPELSMKMGLLVQLARRPMWLVGNALDVVGYVFQFFALRRGSLSLVEPLLVLSLVFALPLAARLDHRRFSLNEITSAATIALGLGLFLGVARPGVGDPRASGWAWAALTSIIVVACGAMVLGARGGSPRRAAVLLAAASGTAFGYVAAVTESIGHILNHGVLHVFSSWELYALALGGAAALLLTQSAFHAGELRLSLPTLSVAQPLVALAIGIGFFDERINSHGVAPGVEVLGLVLMTVGVYALAQPLLVRAEG
jgi:drug/metabolite transporter (DMT)-like permease